MKKQLTKTFHWFVALLCCGLVACGSDDEADIGAEPMAVQFSSSVGNIAKQRTTSGGDQWTAGDKVGVFMLKENTSLVSGNIAEGADNKLFLAQDGNNATSGFLPNGANDIIYYPTSGDKVDFVAYYPYQSSLIGYKFAVDATNQSNQSDIDVLYSNNAKGYHKNSSTVDLRFNHVMSKLSFTLKVATDKGLTEQDLKGAKIEVSNLERKADFDLTDGRVKNPSDQGVIEANVNETIILPPQSFSGGTLTVTLTNGKDKFDCPFSSTEFKEGKDHRYNITVSQTGITVSTGNITDWDSSGAITEGDTAIRYRVGDYYPDPDVDVTDPAEKAEIQGIVYWLKDPVDGKSKHGKIVSLDEKINVPWGNPAVDEQGAGVAGIRDENDGQAGTKNLIAERKDQADFATTYGAFNWIYQTKNKEDINGMWYLPAKEELSALYIAYSDFGTTAFNYKLTVSGGVELTSSFYWSSSESNNGGAWDVLFDVGNTYPAIKNNSRYVRAVSAF